MCEWNSAQQWKNNTSAVCFSWQIHSWLYIFMGNPGAYAGDCCWFGVPLHAQRDSSSPSVTAVCRCGARTQLGRVFLETHCPLRKVMLSGALHQLERDPSVKDQQALVACFRFLLVIGPKSLLHLSPKSPVSWLWQLGCDAVAGDGVVKHFLLLLLINCHVKAAKKKG